MPVDLIDPEGRLRSVDDADLETARSQGYRPASGQEAWATEHPGKAAFIAGVRALPFGTTALQARGETLGIDPTTNADTLKALEERNPAASTAASVGTTLATGFATGGAGWGAVLAEGGLYGLSAVVDEHAIENREATVEEMAAGGLKGALVGGAFFGGLKLAGKAASKLSGLGLSEHLTTKADNLEWDALTSGNNAAKAVSPELKAEVLRTAREAGITGGLLNSVDKKAATVAREVADAAESEMKAALQAADAALEAKGGVGVLRERVVNKIWDTWEEAGLSRNPTTAKHMTAPAEKALREEIGALRSAADLHAWAEDTLERLSKSKTSKGVLNRLKLQAVREVLSDIGTSSYAQAAKKFQASKKLAEFLDYQVTNGENFSKLNTARAAMGALGFGAGGPVGAVAAAAIAPVLNRRGGLFGAALLRGAAVPAAMAKGLLGRASVVPTALMATARARLERASAEGGPEAVLAEHANLAREPGGDTYLASLGLSRETPEEVTAASARLAALDGLAVAGEDRQARWEASIGGLLGGGKVPASGRVSNKDFKARQDALLAFLDNAEAHFEPGALASTHAEALGLAVNAARYLKERLPKDPNPPGPDSLKRPWEPSEADKQKWLRYLEAVEDPQNVLSRMSDGSLMPEHVEAFQAAYPTLYADLQSKLYEALHTWQDPVSYRTKLQLSLMFGPKAFGLDQDAMKVLQASQAIDEKPQGGSMSPDGRQKVSVSRNLETQAQRLQGR